VENVGVILTWARNTRPAVPLIYGERKQESPKARPVDLLSYIYRVAEEVSIYKTADYFVAANGGV
jgi:hypothetical protein